MDVCPIAASDISAWLGIHQIVKDEAIEFYWIIRTLDHVYFQWKGQQKPASKPRK